jgi:hypothetical protein
MDKLFSHPFFKLIFIDDDGKMSLEGPFDCGIWLPQEELLRREESIKKIQKIGYRCISHVWGTADKTKDYTWKDHGVIGVTWKVEVREEKRERIMQIFNRHKGYFWMDVLCTDQDTDDKPLDVMGNIYEKCEECICMLDIICNIDGSKSEKDVLLDISEDLRNFMEHGKELSDEKYGKLPRRYNSLDLAGSFPKGSYELYLGSLMQAEWFERVWTWQEAVLPPKLLFCSERANGYEYDPYDRDFLAKIFPYKDMGYDKDDKLIAAPSGRVFPRPLSSIKTITNLKTQRGNLWENIVLAADSNRKCTNKEDFVYGIIGILDIAIKNGKELDEAMEVLKEILRKNGIFIGEKTMPSYTPIPNTLSKLYEEIRLIDGITVLKNAKTPDFRSDLVRGRKNHGIILWRSKHENHLNPKTYGHIRYKYATGTSFIYLEKDEYRLFDTLETIRIGREGCTYGSNVRGHKKDEIFEIKGNKVKLIGYIVDRSYEDVYGNMSQKSIWS